jgi:hypothetical protein
MTDKFCRRGWKSNPQPTLSRHNLLILRTARNYLNAKNADFGYAGAHSYNAFTRT